MSELEKRVSGLLSSPLGCLFLVAVSESEHPMEEFANPQLSLRLAAECADYIEPHSGANEWIVPTVLDYGHSRRDLAISIVTHPDFSWWFAPVDRSRQIWISFGGSAFSEQQWRAQSHDALGWERKTQKPYQRLCTSTGYEATSSLLTAYDMWVGDHICDFPLVCYRITIPDDYRVFEVHGPEDWHRLCLEHPARRRDGRLTPDWSSVAQVWDGVHLSFGGLLSCEQAEYEGSGAWSKHGSWQAELSYWFRTEGIVAEKLADYQQNLNGSGIDWPFFEEELEPGSTWLKGVRPVPAVLPPRSEEFRVVGR